MEDWSPNNRKIYGDVLLFTPLSWRIFTYSLSILVVIGLSILFLGEYEKVITADGAIVPEKGVITLRTIQPGVVLKVLVEEGDEVKKGDFVAEVGMEQYISGGNSILLQQQGILEKQLENIDSQIDGLRKANYYKQEVIQSRKNNIEMEIDSLHDLITSQLELVSISETQAASVQMLFDKDLLSSIEMNKQRSDLLTARQALGRLRQDLKSKEFELESVGSSSKQSEFEWMTNLQKLESSKLELRQRIIDLQAKKSFVLKSPASGIATAILVKEGQQLEVGQDVASVVPEDSALIAEVLIPATSIGFIAPGQQVKLQIDTFPYQKYGVVDGKIINITKTTFDTQSRKSTSDKGNYLAKIKMDNNGVFAYKSEFNLQAGMSLKARIQTQSRTLFEWLFDPVFAVANR